MARATSSLHPAADLPFLMFVAVADAGRAVGAAEADAFFRLLRDPSWARCAALADDLPEAARLYPDHWRRYIAGEIAATAAAVCQRVEALTARWTADDVARLEADLLHIASTLRSAARKPKLPGPTSRERPMAGLEAALLAVAPASAEPAVEVAANGPARATAAPKGDPSRRHMPIGQVELWDSVHTPLRCVQVKDETSNVRTFSFVAEPERLFAYKPGQFMTIELAIAGRTVRRSYTIASSPARPRVVAITVKRVAGGLVSNWLHDHMSAGDRVTAVIANGKFNCWDIPADKLLLLSAGVGITPVMSIARWHFDVCADVDTVFLHSACTPADIPFYRELELMASPHFKVLHTCTRLAADADWSGLRGRLDATMLASAVPDARERVVFMCGPESYMKAMREALVAAGCADDQVHQESFGPRGWDAVRQKGTATTVAAPAASSEARIVFARSGREVTCASDELILEVAERSGVDILSSCRVGACGTCKVRKTSGIVHHEHCPGLSASEEEQGYVLTCSSTAEGTVVLDA